MDRRAFIATCSTQAAGWSALASGSAWAADAVPRPYPPALLVDARGEPLRASGLRPRTNYVFHYPYAATPVFLLDLGQRVEPVRVGATGRASYLWPGGVGAQQSVVAFSAICAHKLVYPTRDVSFISFRTGRSARGVQDNVIHCCAEHSQYDPARGAQVLAGPAPQPLCAVLLRHDPQADTLTAHATLGPELFEQFFRQYEAKLAIDVGPGAKQAVERRSTVRELEAYCRNPVRC